MTHLKRMVPFAIAGLIALSSGSQAQSGSTTPATTNEAIVFNAATPPTTGRPGRRSDAGSRGCGVDESASTAEAKPLLALVPTQKTANATVVFGKTAAERPTFWFYVPYRSPATASFVLQDQGGTTVYEANVSLAQKPGMVGLTLPASIAPLASGKPYQWFFKVYCRPASPPDSFVDGWIQREALTSDLIQKLKTATLLQQVRLYAANGFWFDALLSAAKLRQTNASDLAWAELLKAIALDGVATEDIATP
ncbi:MAG: DUF928 domain-containing protein [Leptolyngbyaceae cyanobacterium bins.349]|nr:DUF928 domain-containing protein [Leptolyngbyaceae cyanobacterium bins.349]